MKSIKNIYKKFFNDLSFTLLCSTTIIIGVFLIYLIFVFMLMQIDLGEIMSSFFGLILLLICLSLILGILSPFVYILFACNGVLHTRKKDDVSYKSFLKTYRIGARIPFKGQLQVWNTLVNSFLIYIVVELLIMFALSAIATNDASPFKPLFDELMLLDFSSVNWYSQMDQILAKYEDLIRLTSLISTFFSLFFATYYFFHTIARNTLRYYLAPTLLNAPNRLITYVFKGTLKLHRKEYVSNYYKTLWPLTLLYVISFTLSYFLIGFYGPSYIDIGLLSLTSILISCAVLLPFLPLVFNYHESIWNKFALYFMELFLTNASRELNTLKSSMDSESSINKKNIEIAEKNIEKIRQAFEENKDKVVTPKEDNENKSTDEKPKDENNPSNKDENK